MLTRRIAMGIATMATMVIILLQLNSSRKHEQKEEKKKADEAGKSGGGGGGQRSSEESGVQRLGLSPVSAVGGGAQGDALGASCWLPRG